MPRVSQLSTRGAFNPQPRVVHSFGDCDGNVVGAGARPFQAQRPEKQDVRKAEDEPRTGASHCTSRDRIADVVGKRSDIASSKVWANPDAALTAVEALIHAGKFGIATPTMDRQAPLGVCLLLGFWATSGDEIKQRMRWDGMQYRCRLEIPAKEEALFQIQAQGDKIIYPSIEGANPGIAHDLLGPYPGPKDNFWFIESSKVRQLADISMGCPRGCAVALGWQFAGEEIPADMEAGMCVNAWRVNEKIGQGKQGGCVYLSTWPGTGKGGHAAMKFPVEPEELQIFAKIHDIQGLPDLLDFGNLACLGSPDVLYMAMSRAEPCFDTVLRGRLHLHDPSPKVLGRLSWLVVAGLGLQVFRTLQAIHQRGILHCDLKPGNLLLLNREPWLQLIDFGRAGLIGATSFDPGHGGMRDFMSIKSGLHGGQRSAADDLESLGWMLFRCLHGCFPWSAKIKPEPDESWQEGGKRVARDKIRFLDEGGIKAVPKEIRFIPDSLLRYLRDVRDLGDRKLRDADYEDLAKHLSVDPADRLSKFVAGYYAAAEGGELQRGAWPYVALCNLQWLYICEVPAPLMEPSTERPACVRQFRVAPGLLLRVTGCSETNNEGVVCLELDPLWSHGLPPELLRPCWLLAQGPAPGQPGGRSEQWLSWGMEFDVQVRTDVRDL
eukprot:TRINITY_DN42200_c0_g1_i1.p1 TRINITY_DN42200_c0_g1~~TRINITY_DN42200_c0_g1_i1.p1  ORF type:complete len:663 (+),score=110.79 TRINITY_DN42200_c0_g1_i1:268-2256(+)